MKYSVNYSNGNEFKLKYVGSIQDYKDGGLCDPILMEKDEAEELLNDLNEYVCEEYIGSNDDENELAHNSFERGGWGFSIEEFPMPGDEVETLEELAEYYNDSDDYPLDLEDIIERNGWVSDTGTEFGICHDDTRRVVVNERGIAEVLDV